MNVIFHKYGTTTGKSRKTEVYLTYVQYIGKYCTQFSNSVDTKFTNCGEKVDNVHRVSILRQRVSKLIQQLGIVPKGYYATSLLEVV